MSKLIALAGMLLFASAGSSAQVIDHAAMDHSGAAQSPIAQAAMVGMDHQQTSRAVAVGTSLEPKEPGQAAYAALGETVRILMADPNTDWSKVNIDTLRRHLVDMDNVTTRAVVTTTRLPNGATFRVTGESQIVASIQRMTSSHFAQPDFGQPWTMRVQPIASGADVTIVSSDPSDAAKINGLGFFGILTLGAHHQPHHLMMARGGMRH